MQISKKLLLIGGIILVTLVAALYMQKLPIVPNQPTKGLMLSDFPEVFNTVNNNQLFLAESAEPAGNKPIDEEKLSPNFTVDIIKKPMELTDANGGISVFRGCILVIKNTGNVKLTNIAFRVENVKGKIPRQSLSYRGYLYFGVVENISTFDGMEVKVGKEVDNIPDLDVNKSIYLVNELNNLCFENISEFRKYQNSGWLVVKSDQGVEQRIPSVWSFKPVMKYYGSENIFFYYLELFLFFILPPALVVIGIFYLINKIRRKR